MLDELEGPELALLDAYRMGTGPSLEVEDRLLRNILHGTGAAVEAEEIPVPEKIPTGAAPVVRTILAVAAGALLVLWFGNRHGSAVERTEAQQASGASLEGSAGATRGLAAPLAPVVRRTLGGAEVPGLEFVAEPRSSEPNLGGPELHAQVHPTPVPVPSAVPPTESARATTPSEAPRVIERTQVVVVERNANSGAFGSGSSSSGGTSSSGGAVGGGTASSSSGSNGTSTGGGSASSRGGGSGGGSTPTPPPKPELPPPPTDPGSGPGPDSPDPTEPEFPGEEPEDEPLEPGSDEDPGAACDAELDACVSDPWHDPWECEFVHADCMASTICGSELEACVSGGGPVDECEWSHEMCRDAYLGPFDHEEECWEAHDMCMEWGHSPEQCEMEFHECVDGHGGEGDGPMPDQCAQWVESCALETGNAELCWLELPECW